MKKTLLSILTLCAVTYGLFAENYPYRSDVLWVAAPDHADWLYKTGEKAKITLSLYHYGMPVDGEAVTYEIGQDCLDADTKGRVVLKNGKAVIDMGTMKSPGFRDCRLRVSIDGKHYEHHVKVGFSPEEIKPYTRMPQDFDAFWAGELKRQQTHCPIKAVVTPSAEYSTDKIDCYLVKLQCDTPGQYVYGYLSVPKLPGKYPVLISPPGAGIKPMNPSKRQFYTHEGIIRFDMEIHGISPALDADSYKEISATFGAHHANGYLANGISDRDTYYMKRVYLACVRAIDYLCGLPQWDGKNVIAQGGSQGGALALIAAALDSRVTACVANHPALADMAGYAEPGRTGGYPHFGRKYKGVKLSPDVIHTLSYYDVVSFARRIAVPVFMTWGYNDNVCPPTTSYAVYNVLNAPKEALITPVNEHWTSSEIDKAQLEWVKSHLK